MPRGHDGSLGVSHGAEQAFVRAFHDHSRDLLHLATLLTCDPAVAEDVTAGTFANVYAAWQRTDITHPGAYLGARGDVPHRRAPR